MQSARHVPDSSCSWFRLAVSLALSTTGGVGMGKRAARFGIRVPMLAGTTVVGAGLIAAAFAPTC